MITVCPSLPTRAPYPLTPHLLHIHIDPGHHIHTFPTGGQTTKLPDLEAGGLGLLAGIGIGRLIAPRCPP